MILKTGWAEDPQQRMIQRLMLYGIPLSLLVSGSIFPIGVIIYWVTNNLFTLGQQQWVLRKFPPPVTDQGAPATRRRPPPAGARCSRPRPAASSAGTSRAQVPAKPAAPKVAGPKPGAKPANPKKGPAKRQG